MSVLGIQFTSNIPAKGWEEINPDPLTEAEEKYHQLRTELAQAWKDLDHIDEKIEAGQALHVTRANIYNLALRLEQEKNKAWDIVNQEKAAKLAAIEQPKTYGGEVSIE